MKRLDTATGATDLAWNLVQIFFLTTVLAANVTAQSDPAAAPGSGPTEPVAVGFAGESLTLDALEVRREGQIESGQAAFSSLRTACATSTPARLSCPPDASHGDCRAALAELRHRAPGCRWSY